MDERAFHLRVADLLEKRLPFAVATIVRVDGSCPRGPGTKMLVHPDGRIEATIGGGRFEAMVIHDAVEAIEAGEARIQEYRLTKADIGMYCAGRVEVLIEPHRAEARLVVFGGGHVGQALVDLAAGMGGFHVTLIDDRPAFASKERHPRADEVVLTDEAYQRGVPTLDEHSYVAIVTRCHDVDKLIIRRLARAKVAYLGMIGSAAKARAVRAELEREGVPADDLARVRSPIGLPIGGKSPGEIALSILAEIQVVRDRLRQSLGEGGSHPSEGRAGADLATLLPDEPAEGT